MIELYAACGILAFTITFILAKVLIPKLRKAGITGKDENKEGAPEIPEMGGISIIAGQSAGLLLAIFFSSFFAFQLNLPGLLAAIITIYIIAVIGITDDLLSIPQWLKAVLPLFAAIPLVAVNAAGSTVITVPLIGAVDFGIIYILALIPLGVAIPSNLTNMLAGFNGMEAGMGAVMFGAMTILAVSHASPEMAVMSVSMLGALLAFLFFNFYPAKLFPGDVGNLSIGTVLAATVIIGNLESAGAILAIPYVIDWFVKLYKKFPHTYQELRDGKLYPKGGKIKGLVHIVMKSFNGITERSLVLFFIGLEALFAGIVLFLYI
ncbi:hypothetical protein GF318_03300 [Candidatus Micrarchaeota archaeon]|nr:hypothetical protein [Candidatus Micrarchaeota archaeon]